MPDFIKVFIYNFKTASPEKQFLIFLAFFLPFIITAIVQTILKRYLTKKRIKKEFLTECRRKKLSNKEINFIKNILNFLNIKITPRIIKYSFNFVKIISQYAYQCINKKIDIYKAMNTISRLKHIGQKIFADFPERYFTTRELPIDQKVTLKLIQYDKNYYGIIFKINDTNFVVRTNEAIMPQFIKIGSPIQIKIIQGNEGIYYINSIVDDFKVKKNKEIYIAHSIDIIFKNLRRYKRYSLNIPVQISDKTSSKRYQKIISGILIDISRGGCKLSANPGNFLKNTIVNIKFFYNDKEYSFSGRIIGKTENLDLMEEHLNIKFEELSNKEKRDLNYLIYSLEEKFKDKKS